MDIVFFLLFTCGDQSTVVVEHSRPHLHYFTLVNFISSYLHFVTLASKSEVFHQWTLRFGQEKYRRQTQTCCSAHYETFYRGADKSLARPNSRCILFNGENISFDASLVICI